MAKIVTKDQRLVTGATNPISVYSRIVSCVANPKPGNDPDFAYTTVVGENVWLLGVKIFFMPVAPPAIAGVDFRIVTGTIRPFSAAAIANWEDVLPLLYRGITGQRWTHYYGVTEMSWQLKKLYVGQSRRFGVWAQLAGAAAVDMVQVSFHVSEG